MPSTITSTSCISTQAIPSLGLYQRIQAACQAIRLGKPVILLDDHDREDEADLILSAELITDQTMAQLIRDCSGIVCLCLTHSDIERLHLVPMVENNQSKNHTGFTVSIEAKNNITTGVSAKDRVTTIQCAINPLGSRDDIVSPGHVFPLLSHQDGIYGRRGHTEGAVHLAKLAGLRPQAVLCELMNDDGTMMRGKQIQDYADIHRLVIISIQDLIEYDQLN